MFVRTSEAAHQILPKAAHAVRCVCGYAHDSLAETPEAAIKDVSARHDCGRNSFTATGYDCREHQTIGKRCRECER